VLTRAGEGGEGPSCMGVVVHPGAWAFQPCVVATGSPLIHHLEHEFTGPPGHRTEGVALEVHQWCAVGSTRKLESIAKRGKRIVGVGPEGPFTRGLDLGCVDVEDGGGHPRIVGSGRGHARVDPVVRMPRT